MKRRLTDENRLSVVRPDLIDEWDYEKNINLTPNDVSYSSRRIVWWKCSKGHSYDMQVQYRGGKRNCGCPFCSGKRVCEDNSLASLRPDICDLWDYERNVMTPHDVTISSNKKVWWKCAKGHSYDMMINAKSNGAGCPCCLSQRVCEDNNLGFCNPEISLEWHPSKNGDKTPFDVMPHSGKKVWWLCPKGHSYDMTPQKRLKGMGCYYCSGQKVCTDNCFETIYPSLATEWHPTLNKLTPKEVTSKSSKIVWWRCKKGHEWKAPISSRTNRGKLRECPYCSGRKVCGDNCLSITHPLLSKEWHPTLNGNITPDDVTFGSDKKVWWLCEKEHSYKCTISNRTCLDRGCPECSRVRKTSFAEQVFYFYFKNIFPDAENGYRMQPHNIEIDLFIPSIKLAIEYDGGYYHKFNSRYRYDIKKSRILIKEGLKIIRIRDKNLSDIVREDVIVFKRFGNDIKSLKEVLIQVSRYISRNFELSEEQSVKVNKLRFVDISRDRFDIMSQLTQIEIERSLLYSNPGLSKEWHPTRNKSLKPQHVSSGSNMKVWWLGECGHEWMAVIAARNKGSGCPKCYKESRRRRT